MKRISYQNTPGNTNDFNDTERVRLETALREKIHQLEAVFEAATDSISVYDKDGHLLQMNSAAHEMLGINVQPDYTSHPLSHVRHLELRNVHGKLLAPDEWPSCRILRGETLKGLTAMDCFIHTLDGRDVCVCISGAPIRNQAGEIIGAVAIGRDVTMHRQFERRTQEALDTLFEVATDNITLYDSEGHLTQINNATREMLGLDTQPDFTSRPISRQEQLELRDEHGNLLPQDEWPISRLLRGKTLKGATAMDCLTHTLDGRELYANVNGAPIYDEAGKIIGAIAISRDVTARKLLERRTREALDALMAMAKVLVQTQELTLSPTSSTLSTRHIAGQHLVELVQRVLDCKRVCLVAINHKTLQFHPLAVIGMTEEQEKQWFALCSNRKLSEFFGGKVLVSDTRLPEIILADTTKAPFDKIFNPHNASSMLIAPVYVGSSLAGILYMDYDKDIPTYTEEENALIVTMTKLCALALEREQKQAELKKLLSTLQATNEQLEQANKVQRDFVSIVSHEFRTTLRNCLKKI